MFEENNSNVKVETTADAAYEYAFEAVPNEKRKGSFSLFLVLAGYSVTLSNFMSGAAIGYNMRFWDAVTAALVGDAFLIGIVFLTGIMSFNTGLSTAFLSRKAFGAKGSILFSIILVISPITWIGINGDSLAKMLVTNIPSWPIPTGITAVMLIMIWSLSAARGYKGLEFISCFGVPAALILTIVSAIKVVSMPNSMSTILAYLPSKPMTFTSATASIIGSWVFGCCITPDVCRFGKSKKDVFLGAVTAFVIGLFGLQFCGIMVATYSGLPNFIAGTAAIGIGLLVTICSIVCLMTTQDNNVYAASLAMQNIFKETSLNGKVKHKWIAYATSACAAILGFSGALAYFLPIVKALGVFIGPIPGLLIGEYYFVKKSKENKNVNILAIIAWFAGTLSGYIALKNNFFISAVIGMFTTLILYVILSKLFDDVVNKDL